MARPSLFASVTPRQRAGDVVAGLTVGALLIPQAAAYAQLSGLPPAVGLYASTLPVVVYALLGTSRHLGVGPVAVVALMTASALNAATDGDPDRYVAAAATLALLVGAFHLLLGVARAGWVTNLLSHSVLVGFTSAAALTIAATQAKHVLGVQVPRSDTFVQGMSDLVRAAADGIHPATLAVGAVAIAVLLGTKRWKAFPSALVVMVLGVAVSIVIGLPDRGVDAVGALPAGLPTPSLPDLDGSLVRALVPAAIAITLIGYAESVAVAKVYARRHRYDLSPNQELVALGASNVAAGVFSGMPVSGSFGRSAVSSEAGMRTQFGALVSAGVIVLVLLAATGLFTNLPQAILGAVVITAVLGLIDVREMRHVARVKRTDAATMFATFAGTLILGVEIGLILGVGGSIAVILARMMNPHTAELGRLPGTDLYRNVDRFPDAERFDGVAILRIDVSLNFANVSFLKRRVRQLEEDHGPGLRAVVLDATGINDIDASADAALGELLTELEEHSVELHVAGLKGPVRDALARSGLWQRLDGRIHPSLTEAIHQLST